MNKTSELAYWINERYQMKRAKDAAEAMNLKFPNQVHPAGPGLKYGWSDDPHMGTVRYCNVHREDDKVTRWLAKNWRPNHHAVWEIVLARMVNYIPTLNYIAWNWDLHKDRKDLDNLAVASFALKSRRDQGEKVFTSAYTISTCGRAMDKIDYVMEVAGAVKDREANPVIYWPDASSLAAFHRDLTCINGLGSFLAAQVVADLKNTEGHPLKSSMRKDWFSWSAPGPGSLKGLSEYFGRNIPPANYQRHIELCYNEVMPFVSPLVPPIHMQDFQNCLCEFSKYERVKRGGHVRNKYRPGQD